MVDYKLLSDAYVLLHELGWLSDLCCLYGLKRPHRDCERRYQEFLNRAINGPEPIELPDGVNPTWLHSWYKLTSRAMCTWAARVLPYVARDLQHSGYCSYHTQLNAIKRLLNLL